MSVFGSIGTAIDLVKKAAELAGKVKNIELKEVIVELREKLVEVKEEAVAYREKYKAMEAEIERLKAPPEMEFKDGVYWKEGVAFCPKCRDVDGLSVRLSEQTGLFTHFGKWGCANCKSHFK